MSKESSIVGDLINFRGLVYSPINENGVIFLFGKVAEDLNMYVEEIKPGFPDCIGRRFTGRGWERVSIEFEYLSTNFQSHRHDPDKCDLIVCWENDWKDCPLEVIELKEVIKSLPNPPIKRPDQVGTIGEKTLSVDEYLQMKKTAPVIRILYHEFLEEVKKISEEVWIKVGERVITVYSPERVFLYTKARKARIVIEIFTGGQEIPGIRKITSTRGGEKWGNFAIRNEKDLKVAVAAASESYKRIKLAVKNNEPTGWHATLVEDENEEEELEKTES